jgi:hypothetical protein
MPLTLNPGDSGGCAFYVRADGRHVVVGLNEGTWSYHDFDGQQVAEGEGFTRLDRTRGDSGSDLPSWLAQKIHQCNSQGFVD